MVKKFTAELLGTALLVFFACGTATLTLGKWRHTTTFLGHNVTAWLPNTDNFVVGLTATALAFGLVLMALAYAIGGISGCHVNPAVTLGALLAGRIEAADAVVYWIAQFLGGFAGAVVLWFTFKQTHAYNRHITGLGADGYGAASHIGINATGAFIAEVIMTAVFVYVILAVTAKGAAAAVAGMVIGLTLGVIHLFGISVTGTSVNPARSFGPALVVGGTALHQVWLFIVAPLVGGAIAAIGYKFLNAEAN